MQEQYDTLADGLNDIRVEVTKVTGGLNGVRQEVAELRGEVRKVSTGLGELRTEAAYLRGRFDVLIWAVGINAAATIAILGVLLRHLADGAVRGESNAMPRRSRSRRCRVTRRVVVARVAPEADRLQAHRGCGLWRPAISSPFRDETTEPQPKSASGNPNPRVRQMAPAL